MDLDAAEKLANELNAYYLDSTWSFRWDDAPKRFGQCRHSEKVWTLSRHCVRLNDEEETIETILHEIAHALAGPGHGHDQLWWDISRKLGCRTGARHHAKTATTYMRFSFGG